MICFHGYFLGASADQSSHVYSNWNKTSLKSTTRGLTRIQWRESIHEFLTQDTSAELPQNFCGVSKSIDLQALTNNVFPNSPLSPPGETKRPGQVKQKRQPGKTKGPGQVKQRGQPGETKGPAR